MKIVKQLAKDLYLVELSEQEVDEILSYCGNDFEEKLDGVEIWEGENTLTKETLMVIFERFTRLDHHTQVTLGIKNALDELFLPKKPLRIFKLSGCIYKDKLQFFMHEWNLISEKNAYYEINPGDRQGNKRLKKEMLNVVQTDYNNHLGGLICFHAFCTEDKIEEMQKEIVKNLEDKLDSFEKALNENRTALKNASFEIKTLL